jgi:hypothetical protein
MASASVTAFGSSAIASAVINPVRHARPTPGREAGIHHEYEEE